MKYFSPIYTVIVALLYICTAKGNLVLMTDDSSDEFNFTVSTYYHMSLNLYDKAL